MPEQYTAGENVASWCTKCKISLDHTVVAMVGGAIAKVKCKTCGSVHKFRNPADPPKTRSSRVKKTGAEQPSKASTWEAALSQARGKEQEYTMAGKYQVGDVVNHDRFGKGVVMKIYGNKCDIIFQDRERLMASAN